MTGIKNMMHVSEANTDIAKAVYQMMQFGYFDSEFTVYGSAYLNKDGERRYIVSANEDNVYRFQDYAPFLKICMSPVEKYTEKRKVPAGYEDDIVKQVKFNLAKKLYNVYPETILKRFKDLQEEDAQDASLGLLETYQRKIEYLFDEDYLKVFLELIKFCFVKKLLTKASYDKLYNWIEYIRKQMEDDLIASDLFKKEFHTFAYIKPDGTVKYHTNTQYESIYRLMLEAEVRGDRPSPIFSKTWYYNYKYRLVDAKRDHIENMKKLYDIDYLQLVKKIYNLNGTIDKEKYVDIKKEFSETNREYAQKMYKYYQTRWNVE